MGPRIGTERSCGTTARDPRLQVALNQLSQGKACGLNDAMRLARRRHCGFHRCRQKIEPGAVRLLAENFADPEVGCVSGELMLGDFREGESSHGVGLYWRIEKQVREMEAGLRVGGGSNRSPLRRAARTADRPSRRNGSG